MFQVAGLITGLRLCCKFQGVICIVLMGMPERPAPPLERSCPQQGTAGVGLFPAQIHDCKRDWTPVTCG